MQGQGQCQSVTRKTPKRVVGTVLNKSGKKTIRVLVSYTVRHKKYLKVMRRIRRFIVHDELEKFDVGDSVQFVNCRPLSATKRFRVLYK